MLSLVMASHFSLGDSPCLALSLCALGKVDSLRLSLPPVTVLDSRKGRGPELVQ